jgi:hypothetical protein
MSLVEINFPAVLVKPSYDGLTPSTALLIISDKFLTTSLEMIVVLVFRKNASRSDRATLELLLRDSPQRRMG